MTTVIDALVLTLGLDPTNFIKGQTRANEAFKKTKDTITKHGKEIEDTAKKSTAFVQKLSMAFLELFAVVAGSRAVKDFLADTTKANETLGNLSRVIGVQSQTLSAWQGVAQEAGGSAQDASAAFQGMSQVIAGLKIGKVNMEFMRARGLMESLGGKQIDLSSPEKAFHGISADLEKIAKTDPAKALALGLQMGLPQNFVQMLMRGPKWLDAHLADMRSLGQVTEADTKAADELTQAWTRLRRVMEQFGRLLTATFAPALKAIDDSLTDIGKRINDSFPDMAAKAAPVFEFLKTIVKQYREAAIDNFNAIKSVFTGNADDISRSWKKLWSDAKDTLTTWGGWISELSPWNFQGYFWLYRRAV